MTNVKALIFDVDGTLADTEEVHRIAFNRAFEQAGLSWNWTVDQYRDLLSVTGGKERIAHFIKTVNPPFKVPQNLSLFIAELHKAKTQFYTKMLDDGSVHLRPGVSRLIHEAREQDVRLAIATTTSMPNVEALLNNALHPQAMAWFDVIAAGDMVPQKKPAADIYLYALEHLQLPAHQCIAFEDSENGLKSSTGANLKTIVAINQYTKHHNFSGAEIVLDNFGEPDKAFSLLEGDAMQHTYVDMTLVGKLLAKS